MGLVGVALGIAVALLWGTADSVATLAARHLGAIGYYAFYRGLMIGPVALVSPLSSTSAVATLILSLPPLHDRVTPVQEAAIGAILLGAMLASANLPELRVLLKKGSWFARGRGGVGYALAAAVAFGAMDFGIGPPPGEPTSLYPCCSLAPSASSS